MPDDPDITPRKRRPKSKSTSAITFVTGSAVQILQTHKTVAAAACIRWNSVSTTTRLRSKTPAVMKFGIKTTEFWAAIAPIAAAIAHALGLSNTTGDVQSSVGGMMLTILATWLGTNYMTGRQKLKTEPDVRQHIVDGTVEKLRSLVEAEVKKRLPAEPGEA